jgi:hypothetical protein
MMDNQDKTRIQSDIYITEAVSIDNEPIEILEPERPKITFKRYYEPRFVAMKVIRKKQYQMRRV